MVQLTFLEEVKDKASRLIPTAYMEVVEECTAASLSIPIFEHVMFLCDCANNKPETVDDIVRAIRRRINDDSAAVKHLVVLLLDAMVKNCGPQFHVEVSSQKGLLRDLVDLAAKPPSSARGMQGKEAALTLVLNLSIWFAGHPDSRCQILTTLANDVRAVSGPNAFEGIRPDNSTHIRVTDPKATKSAEHHSGTGNASERPGRSRDRRQVVDAIPVNLPKDDVVAGMLDACVAFSEYLNNAPTTPGGSIVHDDVISGFEDKVRTDHNYVTILLSSNLQVDRDVLRSISDSQAAVLKRLEEPKGSAHAGHGFPSISEEVAPPAASSTTPAAGATPPRAVVPVAPADASPTTAPTMDDIFGSAAPTTAQPAPPAASPPAAPQPDDLFGSAPPVPEPAAEDAVQEPETIILGGPEPADAPAEESSAAAIAVPTTLPDTPAAAPGVIQEEVEVPHSATAAAAAVPGPDTPSAAPGVIQEAVEVPSATSATGNEAAAVEPEDTPAVIVLGEPAPATNAATAAADDDDDFDAFLNGTAKK